MAKGGWQGEGLVGIMINIFAKVNLYKWVNFLFVRLFLITFLTVYPQHASASDDLFTQIQTLQDQSKIEINGLEKIQNGEKILTHGNLEQQIKQLFSGYNHIVSRSPKGQVERIVILNKKEKPNDNRIQVPIQVKDNHSTVSVAFSGDGRIWQTMDMVIDTGADLVVLPESMIAQLGIAEDKFIGHTMQTANGIVQAKLVTLKEVKIAGESIENVETAFIPDYLLGGTPLLGMSVLGRYQINIDDKDHLITLIRK